MEFEKGQLDEKTGSCEHQQIPSRTQKFSMLIGSKLDRPYYQGDSLFRSTEQQQLVLRNDYLNKTRHNSKTNHPNSIL